MTLELNCRTDEGLTVVDLAGIFDMFAQDPIDALLGNGHGKGNNSVIWNFRDVSSINSSGIGILLSKILEMKKQGRINMLANVNPAVLDVFQVHKVLPALTILSDEGSARRQIEIEKKKQGEEYIRLFDRINVELSAKFKQFRKGRQSSLFSEHSAEAKSLSRCGIFLQTPATYPADTILEVKLLLPEGLFKSHVDFLGKVVWVADGQSKGGYGQGMALSILNIEDPEKAKLEEYLNHHGV